MMSVRPNFFIVGAPKSGTTTLYHYLREHPSVFMPLRKEPHYFAKDLYAPRYISDEQEYYALFEDGVGKRMVGEASVYYLYSKEAANRIFSFDHNAKVIIMIRNPIDMLHALHSQRLYSGYEEIAGFEDALDAEEERMRGLRIPRYGYPVPCLFYTELGKLGEQVQRYLGTFPRNQIHVIQFDDFVNDTPLEYQRVCEFLEISSDIEPYWTVHNPNKRIRSAVLRRLLKFTPVLRQTVKDVVPVPIRRPIKNAIVRANTKYEPRPPLSEQTRWRLQSSLKDDMALLGELLNLDVSHWMTCARWTEEPAGHQGNSERHEDHTRL